MPPPLTKVKPGDALAIPAIAYNAFVDAAKANQADASAFLQVPQSAFQQSGIILVRNDSGADRERFDVLGIDSPVFDPADDEDAFKNRAVLAGLTPADADHLGRFVILLEPVAAGAVGRACIAGVCPAWVNFTAADDSHADVYDGDATQLKSGPSGAAQVLWKQEGTGPLWAVVRLGPSTAAVRWGVVFDYPADPSQTLNSVSVHPCRDAQGGGVDESTSVTLFVVSPVSVSPTDSAPNFHNGDVIAYLPFSGHETGAGGAADGIVVSPDLSVVFAGHNLLDGDLHADTDQHTPPNGGDIIYADGALWKALPIGAAGTVLKVVGGLPAWGQGAAGANPLLDGANHSDTIAAGPAAGSMIYAHGAPAKWDSLAAGGGQSILRVDANGLPAWFAAGAAQSILSLDANAALAWLAKGANQSILYVDGNGAVNWLAASVDVNKSLSIDSNGHLAWQSFSLLDNSHHHDCTSQGNPPGHGSIIAGGDVLGGGQAWQEVTAPADDGCPLRSASGQVAGVEWFDGPSFTQDVPDGAPYWDGNTLKQKYRTWTIAKGLVSSRGDEQIGEILTKGPLVCPE